MKAKDKKTSKSLPKKTKEELSSKSPRKRNTDWDAVEREYRIGQKTMRTIADAFNLNVSSVSRRAKKEGWVQDKSAEVRQRTNATLIAQRKSNTPTRDDIEAAVQTNIQVITNHRKDIKATQDVVAILRDQLIGAVGIRSEIEKTISEEVKDARSRNAMMKAVSIPAHIGAVRDLSLALKNLVGLERQAYNLDEKSGSDEIIEKIQLEFL